MAEPTAFNLGKPELRKLHARLEELFAGRGGADAGLTLILDDFYGRMARDILVGYFFDGKDLKAIAAAQKAFLLRAMGATPSYSGKAPAQAHGELPDILSGHFDRRLRLLEQTLAAHGLDAVDIRTWVAFENAFRDGIVTKG